MVLRENEDMIYRRKTICHLVATRRQRRNFILIPLLFKNQKIHLEIVICTNSEGYSSRIKTFIVQFMAFSLGQIMKDNKYKKKRKS